MALLKSGCTNKLSSLYSHHVAGQFVNNLSAFKKNKSIVLLLLKLVLLVALWLEVHYLVQEIRIVDKSALSSSGVMTMGAQNYTVM